MSIVLSSDAKFTGFIEFTSPPQKAKMPYLVSQLYMNWKKKQKNLTVLKWICKWNWPNYPGKLATLNIKDYFY